MARIKTHQQEFKIRDRVVKMNIADEFLWEIVAPDENSPHYSVCYIKIGESIPENSLLCYRECEKKEAEEKARQLTDEYLKTSAGKKAAELHNAKMTAYAQAYYD